MARLILDTTVLINLERNGGRPDQFADPRDEVAIAAITAAELLVGVELASSIHRRARHSFVEEILRRIRIESYDLVVARLHANLIAQGRRTGRPRQAHDLIVAATAGATERTVVTLDRAGFEGRPGVDVRS